MCSCSRWDKTGIAKEEGRLLELKVRMEKENQLRNLPAQTEKERSFGVVIDHASEEADLRKWLSQTPEDHLESCVPYAVEVITPCANEYAPNTDSGDSCVKRRMADENLARTMMKYL